MNLKLKRLVRTTSSEQYALFDLDQTDSTQQPITIGKLDLHYTGEGTYGTILLWDEASRGLAEAQRSHFVRALLEEIAQPMGVPNEYVVELFTPSLSGYEIFHNVGGEAENESTQQSARQAGGEQSARTNGTTASPARETTQRETTPRQATAR